MSAPDPTTPASPPPKSRWRYWIELFIVCLISVLVARTVAYLGTQEGVEAVNDYMETTLDELKPATPYGVYRLFSMSMSGIPDDTRPRTFQEMLAQELCTRAGDMQFIRTAITTPEEGTLAYLPNGRPYCEPVAVVKPRSTLEILKEYGLVVPETPMPERNLTPDSYPCLKATEKMGDVRKACLATIPDEVAFWGAKVGDYAESFSVPIVQNGVSLLRPLAAMADVVWNNLLDWSRTGLLKVMLVVAGFLLSLWIVLRFIPLESPLGALFALFIVIPLGTLGFATGLNWAGLELARRLLQFGVDTTDLVITMLASTAFTLSVLGKTLLMMGQEHLAEVRKQTAGR